MDKIKLAQRTIALLSSMIESGESHTARSREMKENALEGLEQLRIHDVSGRSELFKCHSCGTNHSGKNDDQLYEVCRSCFDGI
jgi:rubrerythrin